MSISVGLITWNDFFDFFFLDFLLTKSSWYFTDEWANRFFAFVFSIHGHWSSLALSSIVSNVKRPNHIVLSKETSFVQTPSWFASPCLICGSKIIFSLIKHNNILSWWMKPWIDILLLLMMRWWSLECCIQLLFFFNVVRIWKALSNTHQQAKTELVNFSHL